MASNNTQDDTLRDFLTIICQFDKDLTDKILKKYKLVETFFNNHDTWVSDFGLSKVQFTKVYKFRTDSIHAFREAKKFDALYKNFPEEIDIDTYKGALDKLNLSQYASNEDVKKKRDQLEANYKIVEAYRKAKNIWE